jgi:hypothetical protein
MEMDVIDQHEMDVHVKILGWLYIGGNAIFLVVGVFVWFLLTGISTIAGDPVATRVLTLVGTFIAGLLSVLSLPGLIAGYGLLRRMAWARILAMIVGFLGLINFPLGTALGVYAFIVLLQREANTYFS